MEEAKLIQVSFQIPPSALDRLSRLAEQLRMLMNAAGTQAASFSETAESERAESDSFELARFQALLKNTAKQPAAVGAAASDLADAEKAFAAVRNELHGIRSAGEDPPTSHTDAGTSGNFWSAPSGAHDIPIPLVKAGPVSQPDAIPAVQADADRAVPDAPEAGRDVQHQIPDVESARTEADTRAFTLAAIQGAAFTGTKPPPNTGSVMRPQSKILPDRWNSAAEELAIPGPAPLTAESVSLAFERDSRRYDNGFPLY